MQISTKLSVELLEDPHEKEVQELATMLGLRKVRERERQKEGEGLASQTQPTPARIAFSITHGVLKAIRAGVGWVWLVRLQI